METSLLKNWIDALKSNKYKQGKIYLKHDDKYCCLGVLGEICNLPLSDLENQTIINVPTLDEIGLDFDTALKYAGMNDHGKTFAEIASIIENDFAQSLLKNSKETVI